MRTNRVGRNWKQSSDQPEVSGFEIGLTGSLSDKWFLSAGYTDLDATDKIKSSSRSSKMPLDLEQPLSVDRLAVNLVLSTRTKVL